MRRLIGWNNEGRAEDLTHSTSARATVTQVLRVVKRRLLSKPSRFGS
jgi:hypothetical protein